MADPGWVGSDGRPARRRADAEVPPGGGARGGGRTQPPLRSSDSRGEGCCRHPELMSGRGEAAGERRSVGGERQEVVVVGRGTAIHEPVEDLLATHRAVAVGRCRTRVPLLPPTTAAPSYFLFSRRRSVLVEGASAPNVGGDQDDAQDGCCI